MQHFVFTKTPTKKRSGSLIAKIRFTRLCNFFRLCVLFRNSQLEFIEIMSKNKRLKLLPSWVGDLACQVSAHENARNGVTGHAAERRSSGWRSRQALHHLRRQDRNVGALSPAPPRRRWALPCIRSVPRSMGSAERHTGPFLPAAWGAGAGLSPCPLLPGVGVPSAPGAGPAPRWPRWRGRPLLLPLGWGRCFFWPLLLSSGI